MAKTEVLLKHPVDNLGGEGDLVTVALGYAQNFLFPNELALPVSRANKKLIDSLLRARAAREAKELEEANQLFEKLGKISVAFALKTAAGSKKDGEKIKVFGSVTVNELLHKLEEQGVTLKKKMIHLDHPLKELGQHKVKLKLHKDVSFDLNVEIVSENPIEGDN